MNYKILFTLICLFYLQNNLFAEGLNDVNSRNGLDVWAVGNNGYIIHSFDGGNYWSRFHLQSINYNSISSFINMIWIAGDNGTLEKSTNGGNTFSHVTLPVTVNLHSIFFFNLQTGWIAGDDGIILNTTNSGLNWINQTSNTSNNLNQIKFNDLSNGVACGSNGTVLQTSDGGNTWINTNTPTTKNLLSIDIKGNNIFTCGVESIVIKSTNRGINWSKINYNFENSSDINSLVMLDSLNYFSAGGGGFIRKSTDGGDTFEFKVNPLLAVINKIAFYGTKGWCISNETNAVIRTTDNGNSWRLPNGATQSFSWELKIPLNFYTSSGNVFAFNPNNRNEIFVTKSNTIYRSINRGNNWTQIASINNFPANSTSNAFLISPEDTNIFLVAMDSTSFTENGKVFRSTNYGLDWTVCFSGRRNPDGCPIEMDPNHPDTVYYAPSDSFLYRSTNFGLSWNQVGTKRFSDICIVEVMENNSNVILVGDASDHGTLYRSSDFGLNWSNVNDTLSFEIPDIANSKIRPDYVYCAFYEGIGGLKWSTNQGVNWINVNINYLAWAVDIARDDPNTFAYGTWSNNPIYLTSDGGINFFPTAVIPGGTFALYYYDRTTLLAQMSEGFYKMKINYSVPIGISQISSIIPDNFYLSQNYPNPFNPVTKIKFDIPSNFKGQTSNVKLIVYNVLGEEAITLVNEKLSAGSYEVEFNTRDGQGSNFSSGIYFYKLETENFSEVKRMILLK